MGEAEERLARIESRLGDLDAKLDRVLEFTAFVEETVRPFTEGKNSKYLALLAMKKAGRG
jgi:hypothetical protein